MFRKEKNLFQHQYRSDKQALPPYPHPQQPPQEAQPSYTLSSSIPTKFACLSMTATDSIRLLNFPPAIIDAIRNAIEDCWPRGIQKERDFKGSWEFKMHGNLWIAVGRERSYARRLVNRILELLKDIGWLIHFTMDMGMGENGVDMDTLIFRHQNTPAIPCSWIAVSFNRTDRLRFLDAPADLLGTMRQLLGPTIQNERFCEDNESVYEFKLHGNPWVAGGKEGIGAKMLILNLNEALETNGFTVYASIEQQMQDDGEPHTWHCCRALDGSQDNR